MAAEQFKIKKSIIPNHLWAKLEMLLSKIEMASPLFQYEVLEIWDESNNDFDECLARIFNNIQIDVCLTSNEKFKILNIASNDIENRTQAIETIKRRLAELSVIGIHNFTITSPYKIANVAYSHLYDSIIEICQFGLSIGASISFESFDTGKDKCRLIGNTDQVVELMEHVRGSGCTNFFLPWDLGHFALEEGDYINSLKSLLKYIKRIHISNYCTDKSQWYFGDKHLPFSGEGKITEKDIAYIMDYINKHSNHIESIAFEVAPHSEISICNTPKQTYQYLNSLAYLIR